MQTARRNNLTYRSLLAPSHRSNANVILKAFILSALAAFALPVVSRADVLSEYTFGATVASPTLDPTAVGANVTATPISADAGLALDLTSPATQPPSAPYLRTTFNTVSSTSATAVTNNADFKFTLTANQGFFLDLTSLTFDVMRGGAGTPRGYEVRSSVDNFATTLAQADVGTVRPTFTNVSVDLSGTAFDRLDTITFKIYSYSPATGSSVDYDNLIVNGNVVPQSFTGYTWKGATNSNWNTSGANWTGVGTVYIDSTASSDVLFDDSASQTNVSVTPVAVNPDTVSFANVTKKYVLSGNSVNVATSLSKTGAGEVSLNNVISAATTLISEGLVAIGSTGTLTSPNVTVSSNGLLTVAAGGTLSGTTARNATGQVTFNNAAQTLASLSGANTGIVTLNNTILTVTGASTFSGQMTGGGSLIKNGTGALVLTGFNDFAGGITIKGGAVQLGASSGGIGTIRAETGGTLALAGFASNPVVLAGGTLGPIGAQTLSGTLTVTAASTIDVFNPISGAAPNDIIVTGTLEGNGDIQVVSQNGNAPDGAAFRLRGPISTGANAYSGTITVGQSGKFELQTLDTAGSPMGTGTLVVTAGAITDSNAGTYSLINVRNNSGGNVEFGNNVQVVGSGRSYFNLLGTSPAGSMATFGNLRIGDGQGVGTVATASAEFTMAFSTVQLTGGNATFTPQPVANTSFVSVENISLGTIIEMVAGSGITMDGGATLSLTGNNNYTGQTIVNSGTLMLQGSIKSSATTLNGGILRGTGTAGPLTLSGATIAPGVQGPGILKTGNLSLNGGTLAVQIAGATPGNDAQNYDQIDATGAVVFGGQITLTLDFSAYDPVDGVDQFVLISNDLNDLIGLGIPDARFFFEGTQLNEGTPFTASSGDFTQAFRITYSGGIGGNDVVLLAIPEPNSNLTILTGLAALAGRRRRRLSNCC